METGRIDAGNGCVLLGTNEGTFAYAKNTDTGFWATKEARTLQVIQLASGKKLFLVANNNDDLEAYELTFPRS